MQWLLAESLKAARMFHKALIRQDDAFGYSFANVQLTGQAACDLIKAKLAAPAPAMIARFGSAEMRAALCYHFKQQNVSLGSKSLAFVRGQAPFFWWDQRVARGLTRNAGFFPPDEAQYDRFGQRFIEDMQEVDVLGSWLTAERVFSGQLQHATFVNLEDLPPWPHQNPWSEVLTGKTVLVIHPFVKSIQAQYRQREKLFDDPRVLPVFELKTIQAVQSIAYNDCGFATWFDALDHMCAQMSATEFDVAIIGCGAYGFSLAAHAKRLGRQAVHLGGATQLLFGIKGQRWGDMGNEHWVRPLPEEHPSGFNQIEGGCYW
jgi:hypothetical protein